MRTIPLFLALALACPVGGRAESLLVPEPAAHADDDPVEVDLADLTSIEWEPGDEIPEDIADLDGKKIRISGVMALGTVEGVDEFKLVNDGCSCGTTKLQHFVDVTLADDVTEYTPDEISVVGTFSVGEVEEDGFVVSLYRLSDAAIE